MTDTAINISKQSTEQPLPKPCYSLEELLAVSKTLLSEMALLWLSPVSKPRAWCAVTNRVYSILQQDMVAN